MHRENFLWNRFFVPIKSFKMRNIILLGLLSSFLLSTFISVLSLNMLADENTKAMNMMLTARIYDTINNNFSEPVNVAKIMAATQEVKQTLRDEAELGEELNTQKIQQYLQNIKTSFAYETAFVVSEKTKHYYTEEGMKKTIDPVNNAADQWYSFFVDHGLPVDLSVDKDTLLPDRWTVFINTRIVDDRGHLLGVCGVGVSITDLQELFQRLEAQYNVKINLVDRYGVVKVDTRDVNIDKPYLGSDGSTAEAKNGYIFRTLSNGDFTVTKHVEYLDWDLVVTNQSPVVNSQFLKVIVSNALLSFLIMMLVFGVLRIIIKKSDAKEEEAALLTKRMTAAAEIYIDFQEIDILENTFAYAIDFQDREKVLAEDNKNNAQGTLWRRAESMVSPDQQDQVKNFLNFSTLEKRLKGNRTLTLEFMTKAGLWLRGRFIICQLTPQGKVATVLWLVEDITEERKSREALLDISARATAASEAKSAFLSNMSHEIRTPINAVLGMNEMIIRETGEQNILEYAENIRNAGKSLLSLVNDILDFSKIEAGKLEIVPEEYDLSSLINDLVNMIKNRADAKGLTLTLDIAADMPKNLWGDDMRIKQIITNLLTNAVKYTDKGGIVFALGYEKINAKEILVHVSVKDTGQGIKQEDMHKLFADFERINEAENHHIEGTGLGISITTHLLAMMGTKLEVDSVYGLGSNFYFTLKQKVMGWEPLGDYKQAYRAVLAQQQQTEQEKLYAPEAHVLVVDDNQMNVLVFQNLLKRTGVQIDTAYSGDEALVLAHKKKYDVIFLDHMMPHKDGIATLQELKAQQDGPNIDTPVVCLTANAISGAREKYLGEGFHNYLSKPINPANLEEMLLTYLPADKVKAAADETAAKRPSETVESSSIELPKFLFSLEELDIQKGLQNNGDAESYLEALKIYAEMYDKYIKEIRDFLKAGEEENATIKIHALKSTSRIIGAFAIGELAQRLENAGKAGNRKLLDRDLPELLNRCEALGQQLESLLVETNGEKDGNCPPIAAEELTGIYNELKGFADSCDSLGIEELLEKLQGYRLPEKEEARFRSIKEAAGDFDFEKIAALLDKE